MGEVALKYRIMPESPDSDIANIVSKISEVIPDVMVVWVRMKSNLLPSDLRL